MLAREGGIIPGFVGFDSTVTSELSYVPAVHGAEEIDNLVDADFRLVLRKLSKRDVVTRLKVRANVYDLMVFAGETVLADCTAKFNVM